MHVQRPGGVLQRVRQWAARPDTRVLFSLPSDIKQVPVFSLAALVLPCPARKLEGSGNKLPLECYDKLLAHGDNAPYIRRPATSVDHYGGLLACESP
jgi:hypothetical protein